MNEIVVNRTFSEKALLDYFLNLKLFCFKLADPQINFLLTVSGIKCLWCDVQAHCKQVLAMLHQKLYYLTMLCICFEFHLKKAFEGVVCNLNALEKSFICYVAPTADWDHPDENLASYDISLKETHHTTLLSIQLIFCAEKWSLVSWVQLVLKQIDWLLVLKIITKEFHLSCLQLNWLRR